MSSSKMWRKPKERLRYTNEQSLMLLKEVLDRNPFEDPYRWSTVHENFVRMTGRPHTLRSVREHVDYLLKLYVKGDLENKARYKGSDDEHAEKLQMLQEVLALKEKYFDVIQESKKPATRESVKRMKSESSSNDDADETPDMFLEEDQFESFTNDLTPLKPAAISIPSATQDTSILNTDALQFLKEKHLTDVDLKNKELEQRDKKLTLAEKEFRLAREKFELEKQERLRRLEIEQQTRSMHLKILEQQQKLIQMFFEQHNMKQTM